MTDITLEKLRTFSDRSSTTVTVDAPLFGILKIMHGRILVRGDREADKVGKSIGFPPQDQVIAEASRFWIQYANGVRERKSREEMALLLKDIHRAAGVG